MGKSKIEDRGRIVIPKSIRDQLNLNPGTKLEITIEDGNIKIIPLHKLVSIKNKLQGCIKKSDIDPLEVKAIWKM